MFSCHSAVVESIAESLSNDEGNVNENAPKQYVNLQNTVQSLHVGMQPPDHFTAVSLETEREKLNSRVL